MIGQTISHYRITEKLGEGGMGVVYKAEDTKLERPVALKFLAAHAIDDPEHKARFIREAKAAARLDHQNICSVYEIDEADGQTFLAMAYLEGQTVKDTVAERPLKLDQALDIAVQTAQGLQAAHEKDIVHRDIKSANLMVTPQGTVKVMDFGLAQLADRSKLTETTTILGTPSYMSPEQAVGEKTDRRTDLWSLGVVLYEMIAGRLPFAGERQEAVLYGITNEEPEPVTALRAGLPMELEWIVGKALAKSRDERYQHAEDLLVDLRSLQKKLASGKSTILRAGGAAGPIGGPAVEPTSSTRQRQEPAPTVTPTNVGTQDAAPASRLPWSLLAATTTVALVLAFLYFTEPTPERPVRRFSFTPESLHSTRDELQAAVSPDGRWIVYTSDESPGALWLRAIDSEEPRKLAGTEGADVGAFWSPDSKFIGFATSRQLKKIAIQGGPPIVLCDLPGSTFVGGSWSPDGETMVFSSGATDPVLHEVSAVGGEFMPLLEPLSNEKGVGNVEPYFLPAEASSRALLLSVGEESGRNVYLWNLESGEAVMLVEGARPVYAAPGFIVYQAQALRPGLSALPFSLATLEVTGEAFPIAQGVGVPSVSADGTLVSVDVLGGVSRDRVVWRDRTGKKTGEIGRPQTVIVYLALSPDGRRVAVYAEENQQREVWLHEVDRPVRQRLTFESGNPFYPSWSPDGKLVAYSRLSDGNRNLYVSRADGSTQSETLVASAADEGASDWSPDGRSVIYTVEHAETGFDLWVLDRQANDGKGEATPFVATQFAERGPQISPDGGYVAYCSDESGTPETYVREFPLGSDHWQISENGGCQPRWSHDGKELFYIEGNTLIAVGVTTDPEFRIGPSEHLFSDPNLSGFAWNYDVSAHGRFVMVERVADDSQEQRKPAIHITENWYEEFRDRE